MAVLRARTQLDPSYLPLAPLGHSVKLVSGHAIVADAKGDGQEEATHHLAAKEVEGGLAPRQAAPANT